MSVLADDPNSALREQVEQIKPIGSINVPGIYTNIENALKNGADPNLVIDSNQSPSILGRLSRVVGTLNMAASNNGLTEHEMVEFLRLFVKHGANVKAGEDLLSSPVYFGSKEYVQELLQLGVDPNTPSEDDGMLPVDIAVSRGFPEIADLLVKYGAKMSSKEEIVQLKFVEAAGNYDIKSMDEYLRAGADINTEDKNGRNALVEALHYGFYTKEQYDSVIYLINKGADPNRVGKTEWGHFTSLSMAVESSVPVSRINVKKVVDQFKDSPKYARKILGKICEAQVRIDLPEPVGRAH